MPIPRGRTNPRECMFARTEQEYQLGHSPTSYRYQRLQQPGFGYTEGWSRCRRIRVRLVVTACDRTLPFGYCIGGAADGRPRPGRRVRLVPTYPPARSTLLSPPSQVNSTTSPLKSSMKPLTRQTKRLTTRRISWVKPMGKSRTMRPVTAYSPPSTTPLRPLMKHAKR